MKYFIISLMCFIAISVKAQHDVQYIFKIQSKYNTDVELTVSVNYKGKKVFKGNDLIIKKINLEIRDSLEHLDVIEMYSTKKPTIVRVVDKLYKKRLKEENIIIISTKLIEVKIPEEAKLLNEKLLKIQQIVHDQAIDENKQLELVKQEIKVEMSGGK